MEKAKILVQGIVQGVGFRPTVYRIAKNIGICGFVRNAGNSVEIVVEGEKEKIKKFIKDLKLKKPPLSKITSLKTEWMKSGDNRFEDFFILESSDAYAGSSVIPPDVATCDQCLEEVLDIEDRRYHYPFTACTNCGPRFTVIKSVPYDRERTSMDDFPLCRDCMVEYKNPKDRRYHAEATCCPFCGPSVFLWKDEIIKTENPIKEAVKHADEGKIIAVKGIGGTHLLTKTTDDEPVLSLRKRLGRPHQPFACMSPDVDTIRTFADVSETEEEVLKSMRRPIVVLRKNENYYLSPFVSPKLHTIGVMLPYSALHHLLFMYSKDPAYVMTSANKPGEPMLIENDSIIKKLDGIADYFLLHDRRIINRCDDSVIRFRDDDLAFIRRSRGYVPEPYDFSFVRDIKVLALGPEIDVTFSLVKDGKCYVSQYIGNTKKYETFKYLKESIDYMMGITQTNEIDVVACDLHPRFLTTKLAHDLGDKFGCDVLRVQHHHAHAASLCVDFEISEMICIASDGVGYGEDGSIWGGEILHVKDDEYERLGGLMPQPMAGGDLATKYPIRMVMGMIYDHWDVDELRKLMTDEFINYFKYGRKEIDLTIKQLDKGFNVIPTSSTGRVLDAIAAALGICGERTYEGEPAMKLESAAYYGEDVFDIPVRIKKHDGMMVLDTSKIMLSVLDKRAEGERIENIASSAQRAICEGLAKIAIKTADKKGVDTIGGSGGVFYNEAISKTIKNIITDNGYEFIQHKNTCAGDGSVSLGQAAIASLHYGG